VGKEMSENSFIIFDKDESTVFLNLNQVCEVIAITEDNKLTCTVRLSNSDSVTLDGKVAQVLLARLMKLQVEPNENQN
jgi:hypothetical protein